MALQKYRVDFDEKKLVKSKTGDVIKVESLIKYLKSFDADEETIELMNFIIKYELS